MIPARERNDLVVLVADLDIEQTARRLLNRPEPMGMHPVTFTIRRHRQRDSGCRRDAAESLRMFISDHRYTLVMFDKDGSGSPGKSREGIQNDVEYDLSLNGWENRSKAIVIEPELEAWVWNGSKHVPAILGWDGNYASLRGWLEERGLWTPRARKPSDPKRAMEDVLHRTRTPRSANLYGKLAKTVSLTRCGDPAFNDLKTTLRRWFPSSNTT